MKLEISITESDIQNGRAGDYGRCPIALALMKLGCGQIDVDEDRILVTINSKRYKYTTPRKAMLFISDHDANTKVKPLNFSLEKPKLIDISDIREPVFKSSF